MQSEATFGDNNQGVQIGYNIDLKGKYDERQTITDWLSPLDFCQKQRDVYANQLPGTGEWFLGSEKFKAWEEGGNNVLWCHGIPGSGKTVMTSIIVEHLRQAKIDQGDVGIVPIYCEDKLKELQTPANLLAGLWRGLSQSRDLLAKEAEAVYAKHIFYRTKPTLDEIMSIVQAEIRTYSTVFVVVDALDECPEDRRIRATFVSKLQYILTAVASTETEVRILVTSRLTNSIFLKADQIEIQATDSDIERLVGQRIEDGLSDDDKISQSVRENTALKADIVAMIVERAGKMFLIARLQLDSLATKTTLRSLREAIRCSPKDLDELYLEAWNRVTRQNVDSRNDAQQALCWLSCSFRLLRVQELQHALATRIGDTAVDPENLTNFDHLVGSCAGLVTVDKESQIVRLVHHMAQEFFESKIGRFFPEAHVRLARTCLTYLRFDDFAQGPCEFESTRPYIGIKGPIAASRFLTTRLLRNPFMEYAAHHWGDHARGEATERTLEAEILTFLNTPKVLASAFQAQYRDASTPIHVAVSFALEHILEVLLRDVSRLDLNAEDAQKRTPFHRAADSGLAGCARLLLAAGADINMQDEKNRTLLHNASALGHASIVKMILERNKTAKLRIRDIRAAILSNQKLVIETYIRAAPKPADRANLTLMESSALGKPDIVELAIALGADVDVKDRKGQTALLVTVNNGRSTAAQVLVNAGASTAVFDESGRTLLQVAAFSLNIFQERLDNIRHYGDGHVELGDPGIHRLPVHIVDDPRQIFLKRLSHWIEYGPNPLMDLVKDPDFIAAMNEDLEHPDIIRLLLDHGADLGVKTPEGETVLHLAVDSAPRVKVLLERGAQVLDIDARDNRGRSALHYAAVVGNHASMEILLANGADVTLRDFDSVSTLHFAVNHPACVELAIQKGSSSKALDSRKRTALHYYAMVEEAPPKVYDYLCKAGVDPDAVDLHGKTAFHYPKNPYLGSHGFEETTKWIDRTMYERCILQEIRIRFLLRESSAQASRDEIRFHENLWEKSTEWWMVPDDEMPTDQTQ